MQCYVRTALPKVIIKLRKKIVLLFHISCTCRPVFFCEPNDGEVSKTEKDKSAGHLELRSIVFNVIFKVDVAHTLFATRLKIFSITREL